MQLLRDNKMDIYTYLTVALLLEQGCITALKYCPEAVASVKYVPVCPTSKKELDIAAKRKNCDELATGQNCSSIVEFVYHCTINSYRNATLEVCAPKRRILGHCSEFNIVGGVIQDQHSAPCNKIFPKCDGHYMSSDAYKYDDCYKLAQSARDLQTETTTGKNGIQTGNGDILILIFGVAVLAAIGGVFTFVVVRKKRNIPNSDTGKTNKDQRSTKAVNDKNYSRIQGSQLLNENSHLHADSQNSFLNLLNDDIRKEEAKMGVYGTGSRSDTLCSRESFRSVYYDALDKQPESHNHPSTLRKTFLYPHLVDYTDRINEEEY